MGEVVKLAVRKKVLVTPLDWGLGHATRCVPIIHLLKKMGCEVSIASSGDALVLLQQEFPNLQYFHLPSYKASYSSRLPLMLKVFLQIPKFIWAIIKEHLRLKKIMRSHAFDVVISDHRYGCWYAKAPCVFVTHQINILMPSGFPWLEAIVNYFNHRAILKFDRCWVPDYPDNPLTGKLSVPFHPRTAFVGMLSRFHKIGVDGEIPYHIVAVLSGPEPQRTVLELLLLKELKMSDHKALLIRGIPGSSDKPTVRGNLTIVDYLPSPALNAMILKSSIVICRSGYSSIMDLAAIGRRAIFIPTPGQTEQEYLAQELEKRKIAGFQTQHKLNLKAALAEINHYKGFEDWKHRPNLLQQAVNELLL